MVHGNRVSGLLRLSGALALAPLLGLVLSAPAQAAVTPGTVTPIANCYWDNGDWTVSVLFGYRSRASSSQTEPVGANNRFTRGAANRGQPTAFQPGTHNNVFVADITYAEVGNGINWVVAGRGVDVNGLTECATKPVPQVGDVGALLLGLFAVALSALAVVAARPRRLVVAR